MRMAQKTPHKCSCCGELTKYICADCLVDKVQFVPVCGNVECRNKHVSKDCSKGESDDAAASAIRRSILDNV